MTVNDSNSALAAATHARCLDVARAVSMLGSADSMRKIMAMALQRLDEEVDAIAARLHAGDAATASHMLHGIKGFAPIFCTDQVADHIASVEGLSKVADVAQVAVSYQELAPILARLRDEMRAYLLVPT